MVSSPSNNLSIFQQLTSSQEVESIADVALVADKQQATFLIRSGLSFGQFLGRNLLSIRNSTTNNDRVVMVQVTSRSHLTGMCRKGTFVVLSDGMVIEVVGRMQTRVGVIVRRLINGSS